MYCLGIGQEFPEFSLKAVTSSDITTGIKDVTNEDFAGKWMVFFAWPKDFTFVCPTEIIGFGDKNSDFNARNAVLVGCSTDSEFVHAAWRRHHDGIKNSPFAWLADTNKKLCEELGILEEKEGIAYRATYIVDPNGIIRHVSVNDLSVGRNPDEILRVLDALQSDELCPCAWNKGEDTLKAA